MKHAGSINREMARQGWLSLLPVLVVLALIRGYPLVMCVVKSFTNWNGMLQDDFIGLQNYVKILQSDEFWMLLGNNMIFLLFIPVQLFTGLVAAVLLYEETFGWKFFRSVYYLPQIISPVVTGFLFTVFFSYEGPVNLILEKIGLLPGGVEWLGDRWSAIVVIITCLVWINIGWQGMLYLGGLSAVPSSVYEAARIDGAGYWQRLFKITLPLLGRVTEYSCVISVIWVCTGLFPFIYSMTRGGPGYQTSTIDYMIYMKSFGNTSQLGYASALSIILLVIVLAFTVIQMKASDKANDWEG